MVEGLIVNVMQQGKLPGLSMTVVKEGKPLYSKAFGARNLEENIPMTTDTLIGIGSCTKSFTALAIMQLAEQGKLDINEPIKSYIDFKLGDKKNPITIHHALSHSSGVPALGGAIITITRGLGSNELMIPFSSKNDFLLHINNAKTEIFDIPGKHFFYNNDMYTLLGLIIENISDMKLEDYIRENILTPLGMKRSIFSKDKFEKDKDKLTGYILTEVEKPIHPFNPPFNKFIYAPGGLLSSANEMQNYLIALLNDGKFNGNQIIQKSSLEKMWSPHIKIPEETAYAQGEAGYGYGWMIEKDFFGYTLIQHGGNISTSSALLILIPERKMGAYLAVNADQKGVLGAIARGIFALLLGKDLNEAVPLLKIQQTLQGLVGKYQTYRGITPIEISLENGILTAKIKMGIFGEPISLPLAVENLKELKFYVPVAFPNQKIKVQFFVDKETKKVTATADRYLFHKI